MVSTESAWFLFNAATTFVVITTSTKTTKFLLLVPPTVKIVIMRTLEMRFRIEDTILPLTEKI